MLPTANVSDYAAGARNEIFVQPSATDRRSTRIPAPLKSLRVSVVNPQKEKPWQKARAERPGVRSRSGAM
jgi:hypothetical protein